MSSPEQINHVHSIIKHDRVRVDDAGVDFPSALPARTGANSKPATRCKKSVQLLREKDVVHAIEVRCSCGDITLVEIEYGPQAG